VCGGGGRKGRQKNLKIFVTFRMDITLQVVSLILFQMFSWLSWSRYWRQPISNCASEIVSDDDDGEDDTPR